jgi:hypothetical protein
LGVTVKTPAKGTSSASTRKKATADIKVGVGKPSRRSVSTELKSKRSAISTRVLKQEGTAAGSSKALLQQTHASASRRSAADLSSTAKKG